EMIKNRKLVSLENNIPRGFDILCANGTTGYICREALYLEAGVKYCLRIRARSDVNTYIKYRIKSRYFKVFAEETLPLVSGETKISESGFTLFFTETKGILEISFPDNAGVKIYSLSLKRYDNIFGMRKDVLDCLRDLKPSILRYPGGCYAELYHWKDGLLDADLRPCIDDNGLSFLFPDTYGVDTHEIGIDEFIEACRYTGAEPAITVRLSDNEPSDAADWVEYCNGAPDTQWGSIRASRGNVQPYNVKTWYLGNEIFAFGSGMLRESGAFAAEAHNEFNAAMKARDPGILTVASAWPRTGWTKEFLKTAQSDIISLHNYANDFLGDITDEDGLAGAISAPYDFLLPFIREMFDEYNHNVMSFDEWNYQWGKYGSVVTGLYTAGVLNVLISFARELNIHHACYFTPLSESAVRIFPDRAFLGPDGRVFRLFVRHAGQVLKYRNSYNMLDVLVSESVCKSRLVMTYVNRNIHKAVAAVLPEVRGNIVESVLLVPKNGKMTDDDFREEENTGIPKSVPPLCVGMIIYDSAAKI
ncbi:MAG: hypothetical protein PHZ09_04330, partial [Eubacteriales bacterium]|nr:hypothetical protein [Eubacteriales bacterium]